MRPSNDFFLLLSQLKNVPTTVGENVQKFFHAQFRLRVSHKSHTNKHEFDDMTVLPGHFPSFYFVRNKEK